MTDAEAKNDAYKGDVEKAVCNALDYNYSMALAVLTMHGDNMASSDRKTFEDALDNFPSNKDAFVNITRAIRTTHPKMADDLLIVMHNIAFAAQAFGASGLYTENARYVFQAPFIEQKSEAGRKSVEARQREIEEGWKPHALQLAREAQAKNSDLSQMDLASEIKTHWRLKIRCPKSQLVKAISKWQALGELHKPNR